MLAVSVHKLFDDWNAEVHHCALEKKNCWLVGGLDDEALLDKRKIDK